MWKLFFNTCYLFSYLVPGREKREHFRTNRLFDYRRKLNTLRAAYPEINWRHVHLRKGGGSLAFIIGDTVFKVRKYNSETEGNERFHREQKITAALAGHLPVKIPHIELIKIDNYLFYKSKFIPGRVLVDMPFGKIRANEEKIGRQMGKIIYDLFNSNVLPELRPANCKNCGMVHGDMCSNIIINPKTMDVVGIIDWEFASYGPLDREIDGIDRVRRKMQKTNIAKIALAEYNRIANKNK